MPKLICTEPVCRHEWTEPDDPRQPRCPRCGGFWVRVIPDPAPAPAHDHVARHPARPRPRPLGRRYANTG